MIHYFLYPPYNLAMASGLVYHSAVVVVVVPSFDSSTMVDHRWHQHFVFVHHLQHCCRRCHRRRRCHQTTATIDETMAFRCSCPNTTENTATDYDVALVAIVETIEQLMHDLVCVLVVVMDYVVQSLPLLLLLLLPAVDADALKNLKAARFS